MTVNIYDLANDLERAFRALPEYQEVLALKEEIAKDAEASAVLEEFSAVQSRLQEQITQGQFPSQEEQAQMQEIGGKIESIPALKHYFEQQQRLSVYMADIEKIVFAPLNDLLN